MELLGSLRPTGPPVPSAESIGSLGHWPGGAWELEPRETGSGRAGGCPRRVGGCPQDSRLRGLGTGTAAEASKSGEGQGVPCKSHPTFRTERGIYFAVWQGYRLLQGSGRGWLRGTGERVKGFPPRYPQQHLTDVLWGCGRHCQRSLQRLGAGVMGEQRDRQPGGRQEASSCSQSPRGAHRPPAETRWNLAE